MRLSSFPSLRKSVGWFACLAMATAASACIEARGALTAPTDPNSPQALTRWLASGLIVDWNDECRTLKATGLEDQERPELPSITLDDAQADDAATAADNNLATTEPSTDFADSSAPDDSDGRQYKYGHRGDRFDNQSDLDADGRSNGDSAMSDNSRSDDSSDEENAQELAGQDEIRNNDQKSEEMAVENGPASTEAAANDDADAPSSFEKYYGYRSESLQERIGNNAAEDTHKEQGTDPAKEDGMESDDEDTPSMGSQQLADSATRDEEDRAGTTVTDAVVTLVSDLTAKVSAEYGVNLPLLARLFYSHW